MKILISLFALLVVNFSQPITENVETEQVAIEVSCVDEIVDDPSGTAPYFTACVNYSTGQVTYGSKTVSGGVSNVASWVWNDTLSQLEGRNSFDVIIIIIEDF